MYKHIVLKSKNVHELLNRVKKKMLDEDISTRKITDEGAVLYALKQTIKR